MKLKFLPTMILKSFFHRFPEKLYYLYCTFYLGWYLDTTASEVNKHLGNALKQ